MGGPVTFVRFTGRRNIPPCPGWGTIDSGAPFRAHPAQHPASADRTSALHVAERSAPPADAAIPTRLLQIIDKYVLREHAGPLVFALSALTSLLLLNYAAKQ